ncbi:hypothetical protein E8E11_004456 [Didymella keratinophila]|nr:hypothetical protein E8E11_004456 [Didymella keratinophila]
MKDMPQWLRYDHIDSDCRPIAMFEFKYRSLAALKSLQIIPRSSISEPAEPRSTRDMSRDELQKLVQQLLPMVDEQRLNISIKRERQEDSPAVEGEQRAKVRRARRP